MIAYHCVDAMAKLTNTNSLVFRRIENSIAVMITFKKPGTAYSDDRNATCH